ncbi:MAG: (d)CMP kinase, partial [Bacteroidales bacterium]
MTKLIIAIDGYSSTGKGTFAVEIARRLGILYLDSGALYRTVTLYALRNGQIEWNGAILEKALQEDILLGRIDISVLPKEDGSMRVFLDGEDVSAKIRELEVARNVSAIATLPFVRNFVDEQLHRLGAGGCVMDGRDIGTAVFPNADLK